MNETKTIRDWEKQKGFIVKTATDLDQQMTEQEFDAISLSEKHGVDHESRTQFLNDNGYEVTRENMINTSLSAATDDTASDVVN